MVTPGSVAQQVDRLVAHLVEVGLADDQNFAVRRGLSANVEEVTFPGGGAALEIALSGVPYRSMYSEFRANRSYNVLFPDGGLIQLMYLFEDGELQRHRLAFFPSPDLEEFQNSPELYLDDAVFSEVLALGIMPVPVRFDFDSRSGVHAELDHPKSHLSLGQYANCRIPVSAPLAPYRFFDVVLRNFYHNAFREYCSKLPSFTEVFDQSIATNERSVLHIAIP